MRECIQGLCARGRRTRYRPSHCNRQLKQVWGGAGYPSNNLGIAAGQNDSAAQIAIHELGHSLGDLADEYTYGEPFTYTGPELSPVNVSIFDRDEQLANSRKWWRWMDASISGFDGPINSYEGGNYSVNGVYRPSNNSMMRSLGRQFNLVGDFNNDGT